MQQVYLTCNGLALVLKCLRMCVCVCVFIFEQIIKIMLMSSHQVSIMF
jgi:hypothetical protein